MGDLDGEHDLADDPAEPIDHDGKQERVYQLVPEGRGL